MGRVVSNVRSFFRASVEKARKQKHKILELYCKQSDELKKIIIHFSFFFHSRIDQEFTLWDRGSGGSITIKIDISQNITVDQCWQLNLQYQVPISIDNNPWGDGMLVNQHKDSKCKMKGMEGTNKDNVYFFVKVLMKYLLYARI